MPSEQSTTFEATDAGGQRWRFQLSAGTGLKVYRGDQLLGSISVDEIVALAPNKECADAYATALLIHTALSVGRAVPFSIYEYVHAAISQWLWENAPVEAPDDSQPL